MKRRKVAALGVGLMLFTDVAPVRAAQHPRVLSVNNAFSVVGRSVYGTPETGYVAVVEVRNDSQQAATFDAQLEFLDASTAVVGRGTAIVDQDEVLPGQTGFAHLRGAGGEVTDARLVITDSHPVAFPSYRDLSVSPPAISHPSATDVDYTVTVTNTGIRPTTGVTVRDVVRDPNGALLDEARTADPDPSALAPGGSRTVTVRRHTDDGSPSATPMFDAFGMEPLSVTVRGSYDPDIVGGRISTTWHLAKARRCSTRIVRFTATSPPVTMARATSSRTGSVTLRFPLSAHYLYSFLVDGSRTCGPYRFNDLTLKGAITVTAKTPRTAVRGHLFTVSGSASGARKGDLVMVQRRSGGRWMTVARGSVHSHGRFTLRVAMTSTGAQTLRVFVPHTTFHFGAASTSCGIRVAGR